MPKEIENKLKKEAEAKFPGDKERQDAYVYGTLQKIEKAGAREHWYFRKVGKGKKE